MADQAPTARFEHGAQEQHMGFFQELGHAWSDLPTAGKMIIAGGVVGGGIMIYLAVNKSKTSNTNQQKQPQNPGNNPPHGKPPQAQPGVTPMDAGPGTGRAVGQGIGGAQPSYNGYIPAVSVYHPLHSATMASKRPYRVAY